MNHRPQIGTDDSPVYLLPLQVQHVDKSGATLAAIWADIAHRWRLLLILGLVGALGGAAFSFALPRTYRAETLLAMVDESEPAGLSGVGLPQLSGLAELAGLRLGASNIRNEAIATLNSRTLTEEFLRDNDLIHVLFGERWDSTSGEWKDVWFGRDPKMSDAIEFFSDNVRHVSEDPKTGLVTLRIEWRDRELAAQWANALVRRLNLKLQQRAIAESQASLEYLDRQVKATNLLPIRDAASRLTEQELKRIMLASVRSEYAFRVIDPATAADERRYIKPRRLVITVTAAGIGVLAGMTLSVFLARRRRQLADAPG